MTSRLHVENCGKFFLTKDGDYLHLADQLKKLANVVE